MRSSVAAFVEERPSLFLLFVVVVADNFLVTRAVARIFGISHLESYHEEGGYDCIKGHERIFAHGTGRFKMAELGTVGSTNSSTGFYQQQLLVQQGQWLLCSKIPVQYTGVTVHSFSQTRTVQRYP